MRDDRSNKFKEAVYKKTDWNRRIEVLEMREAGMSGHEIGRKLGISASYVYELIEKINDEDMSLKELREMRDKYQTNINT